MVNSKADVGSSKTKLLCYFCMNIEESDYFTGLFLIEKTIAKIRNIHLRIFHSLF